MVIQFDIDTARYVFHNLWMAGRVGSPMNPKRDRLHLRDRIPRDITDLS
jgi:hypothetical protein